MTGYRLTVEGREDMTTAAGSIATVVEKARIVAIELAGPGLIIMTITDPAGRPYPFGYRFDPEFLGSAGLEENVDDVLWDVRATLHYDADQREATTAHCGG